MGVHRGPRHEGCRVKKYGMSCTCGTHGKERKYRVLVDEYEEQSALKNKLVDGRIILKWMLKK